MDLEHQGYKVVLNADIQGFFDNIPHLAMMTGLAKVVADGNILGLVERFLRAGVMENGVFKLPPNHVSSARGEVSR
uniref:Reverse transcriptase (RNA-dependent DNA polymerase) n=1 Tax=Candidatus Kentrum sp. LFY TaxID=2126342 RepID=A0A450WB85_9GAMM|nr:MAG: Reverse transcriptase (RNA-dependent DNA polymerase) [Candidatus Kentron sp. LFY]